MNLNAIVLLFLLVCVFMGAVIGLYCNGQKGSFADFHYFHME